MHRVLARLLMVVFLANVLALPVVEAMPDVHDTPMGYQQGSGDTGKSDAPACSEACHAAFHFIALPASQLSMYSSDTQQRNVRVAAVALPLAVSPPFHPPRSLA